MVCGCNRCFRLISGSVIPGGNPVALADPDLWTTSYQQCPDCLALYCDECSKHEPLCPNCPGPRRPPPHDYQVRSLNKHCRKGNRETFTHYELVGDAWGFCGHLPTSEARIAFLKESLPEGTLAVLVDAARCYLNSHENEWDKVPWPNFSCWQHDTPHWMPKEFFEALANFKRE
jgi:hypothetical protein